MILLGFQNGAEALDLERFVRRAGAPDVTAALGRAGIQSLPGLLAHELLPLGVLHAMPLPGEVHTLFHPRLSHVAARAFFRGGSSEIPPSMTPEAAAVGARNSLAGRWAASFPGGVPDSLRIELLGETFKYRPRLGATLLAQWELERPGSARLAKATERLMRDPKFAAVLEPTDFARLQFLLEGGRTTGTPPCDAAPRIAELFVQDYHHAAPFQRDALRRVWDRCRADPGVGAARAALEARIGRLAPPQ